VSAEGIRTMATGRLRMGIGALRVAAGVSRPLNVGLLVVAVAAAVPPHVPAITARLRGGDGGPGRSA
jgi:hypothetical protein